MDNPTKNLREQLLRLVTGALLAGTLLIAGTAHGAQQPTLTTHVPPQVASGQVAKLGVLPSTQRMNLAISLPLRNEADLDAQLEQIYDPQSPNYHRYFSVQEFTERYGPTQSDYDAMVSFAKAHSLTITDGSANRMVVSVAGAVADIEKAFHVTMGVYQHPTESRTFYAPDREPTLDLDVMVLHISGLDNFTLPTSKMIKSANSPSEGTGSGPGGSYLGSDLRAAYYGYGSLTGAGQQIALFEFAGLNVNQSPDDVTEYFTEAKQSSSVPINGVSLNGVSVICDRPCNDEETALDIETAISMAPGLTQVLYYVGNNSVTIFNAMATGNGYPISYQLTCTAGFTDNEGSLDPIFKEYEAQGQTLFVATGDDGSNTAADVVWPADDPYVTAVGGTDLVTTGPGGVWLSETGWSKSAGGSSKNGIPIPPYQKSSKVINQYNHGSRTLRNYPDVAAEANTNIYSCYDEACSAGNGGTSYAAPQWAGFMALVNQQAVADGDATVGFINPTLYQIGTGTNYDSEFHDIISGSNGKYSAVTGYDLVTGWGSFIGPSLLTGLLPVK
jgi:subtilase family serine protease